MDELKVTAENITHSEHIVVNSSNISLNVSAENIGNSDVVSDCTKQTFLQVNPKKIAEIAEQAGAAKKADMDKAYRYFFRAWILRKIAILTGLTFGFLPLIAVAYDHFWGWPWGSSENFMLSVIGICVLCAITCLFCILFWLNNHSKANAILEEHNMNISLDAYTK